MDRFNYIAVAIGIFLVLYLLRRLAAGPLVSGEEAKKLVAEGATLVDVRSPGEFAGGHMVLYCASGMRSGSAAGMLRSAGRTDVHNLGSISRWPG